MTLDLQIKQLTNDLRNSDKPLWIRMRQLLSEKEINPSDSVLAYYVKEEPFYDFGVIVADNSDVYQFAYDYLNKDNHQGIFAEWNNITDDIQRKPYREQISLAFKIKAKNAG
jgi:hypothetical protein